MPVGPEFQDPPPPVPAPNQQPYFVVPPGADMPFYEQTVQISGSHMFEAVVGDANPDDTLEVRWVTNYPPVSAATMVLLNEKSGDRGSGGTWPFKITVSCDMFMQGAAPDLVAIVSDQGFTSPDAVDAPAYVSKSQVPYNFNAAKPMPQLIATMTGWRIAGCTQ